VKIVLIRLRLIGDVIFTTPLIRALRRQYPDAHLTYVIEPLAEPVVRRNPHLDEVLVIPRRPGWRRLADDVAMGRQLRRGTFDIAIDLHGGPRGAWLAWASGAPMRIGYRAPGRTWMYTHPVPRPADLAPRHAVANQWDLLGPLGIAQAAPSADPVEMPLNPDADATVLRTLAAAGFTSAHRLIVIHVSAGNVFRRWPPESFAALVVQLSRHDPARRFMLTSGPSDADAARAIVNQIVTGLGDSGSRVVAHGQFEVDELRALATRASVYIGGDSGPLHIAAATETPIVALFGPTLPERSMPWRDARWFAEAVDAGPLPCRPCRQRVCAPGDFRCLTRIDPARVIDATERALLARPAHAAATLTERPRVLHA
jgi:predicted lipopolysaccharide heptosyltransferase III